MASERDPWNEISTVGVTAAQSAGGAPLSFTLHVIQGDAAVMHRLPATGSLAIGRGDGVEIRIADPSISRRHAVLHMGRHPTIEDLNSANGTKIGGRPITPGVPVPLSVGEIIELGALLLVLHTSGKLSPGAADDRDAGAVRSSPGEVVEDPAMKRLRRLIDRVAPSAVSVLLLGETGTGKEVLASTIHRGSTRAAGPFVRLNCAALQDTLFESELFGHERGAFTGAAQPKPGLLETAAGGTIFLDEIGELALPLQAKLLRAVEERQVLRVGGLKPRAIDVRFISATNRDLEAEVAAQRFRQDLYFRLNGIPLFIPPLRERPSEILPLAEMFLEEASREAGRAVPRLADETVMALHRHPWPGNIRELRNVVHRAVLIAGDVVTPDCLGLSTKARGSAVVDSSDRAADLETELGAVEKRRIIEVLGRCGGNQSRAAKELGISRNTLLARLRQYGIRS